ncbi:MAG: hypothetical protein KDJ77_15915 [Rhodobiaceae bacterium]|nr:hypothetical protein [Rhodobiaceae bacterium]
MDSISGFLMALAPWICGALAVVIGAGVGAIELLGRYRDEPFEALRVWGARLYIAINAIVSAIVYGCILIFDNGLLGEASRYEALLPMAAAAGFGSLALMRTSFARTQVGDSTVEIGPALVIETLLKVADRSVDRHRARQRMVDVPASLEGLDENVPVYALQLVCLDAMQNLGIEERDVVTQKIQVLSRLSAKQGPPRLRQVISGMYLQQIIGTEAFREACNAIKPIKFESEDLGIDLDALWDEGNRGAGGDEVTIDEGAPRPRDLGPLAEETADADDTGIADGPAGADPREASAEPPTISPATGALKAGGLAPRGEGSPTPAPYRPI